MSDIRFYVSNICTAFAPTTVGSKVLLPGEFCEALSEVVRNHDTSNDEAPGQHVVTMPESTFHTVSAGDGLVSKNPFDYVVRSYREGPKMYLRRKFAGKVNSLKVVVYTREAYLADPDVDESENIGDGTHVIVAVLASHGPEPTLSPFRFCHNLAGGNNAFKRPEAPGQETYPNLLDYTNQLERYCDKLVETAKGIVKYSNTYKAVSD